MITSVDSSVLLDVFEADPLHGPTSAAALRRCLGEGALVASDVVWAEVAGCYESVDAVVERMTRLGVAYLSVDRDAALRAGVVWREYRAAGGKRTRVVADFLVAAHAQSQSDRLLTRDRGFYRTYFRDLKILDPTE